MKFITKNDEPQEFVNWKKQESDSLERFYGLERRAAELAWEHLPSNLPQSEEDGIIYLQKLSLKMPY